MAQETRTPINQIPTGKAGPYLAKVVSHLDPSYMGTLEVELLREVGNNDESKSQSMQVRYMSPFYGATNIKYNGSDPDDYNNTQKSYGMWMIPPDVGTTVMVIFVEGDAKRGYWIGCIPDEGMNFMVPGYAATSFVVNKDATAPRCPVAEYNKKTQNKANDPNHFNKPAHPFQNILKKQGLLKDDIRGITSSSARREVPCAVFGISTPGPVDKSPNAKKGAVGSAENKANVFVSRLGGSSFVMDDGDDKFLRKGPASTSGPVYAATEQGEGGGNVGIPHNELLRLRTRTGHQILMHNSEDLIYIGNASGTTWIELTSNGKIDIFANDSISIHTKTDLNVTADRDINLTSQGNINLNAALKINAQSGNAINIKSGAASSISAGGNFNVLAANTNIDGGKIHLNSGGASAATGAPSTSRIPQSEPWDEHENLDPASFVPAKTKAEIRTGAYVPKKAAMFQKYTTSVDTFQKIKPPEKGK